MPESTPQTPATPVTLTDDQLRQLADSVAAQLSRYLLLRDPVQIGAGAPAGTGDDGAAIPVITADPVGSGSPAV
ncbi:hypothetical protein [Streptomyces sp. H39-S7]|uniref:hypothetical protein n=1 Tax=Streptomyces sp. H39-S7 TaxID=3004357 RepID=UPI0022AFE50A|nr:hypothetical protein [Streptomyces sp. H39-S7]MCZ4117888.1 hypothetical protein [Streptomyces sp. H39-S7]